LRLRSRRSRLLPLGLALAVALAACGSPATGRQVWFGPNMGSVDMIELFTQPSQWRAARPSTDVFKFYEQQLLADTAADCLDCGRNIYPQLARAEAFTRLNAWALRIGIEVGVIKSWGCAASATLPLAREAMRRVETRIEGQGIPFGVIFWSEVRASDEAYFADVMAWVETVRMAIGELTHSIFQSWAVAPDGRLTVPANLPEADAAAHTHTRLLDEGVAALRGGTRR